MQIIGGFLRGRRLTCPKGLEVRPTSSMLRETLFNIIQHKIASAKFLDLFAGSGAMGIEAISRGASQVVFVDNNQKSLLSIKKNLEALSVSSFAKVYMGDARILIRKVLSKEKPFDIIYIDPPYLFFEDPSFLFSLLEEICQVKILKKEGLVFVEKPWKKNEILQEETQEGFFLEKRKKIGHSELLIYRLL